MNSGPKLFLYITYTKEKYNISMTSQSFEDVVGPAYNSAGLTVSN